MFGVQSSVMLRSNYVGIVLAWATIAIATIMIGSSRLLRNIVRHPTSAEIAYTVRNYHRDIYCSAEISETTKRNALREHAQHG